MPAAAARVARPVDADAPAAAPIDPGAALVADARAGDRAALSRLHERFAPVVHGVLLARLPHADCEDLVQEVFLNVARRLESLRDDRAFPAWICTMARNLAASVARGRARRARREAVVARITPGGAAAPGVSAALQRTPHDDALTRLQAQEALDAIRALPESCAEALILRLVEGLTGPQIAARTGMTHGAVRVNLHRGMTLLRQRLGIGDEP